VQNSCKIEDYYLNDDIFKIDSTYLKVSIDGKSFKVKVLSDKLNEYLEEFELSEYDFNFLSPKTVVFYSDETGDIVFVKKFDPSKHNFFKQSGNLSKEGKLYMNRMITAGGSGISSNLSLVSLKDGKIVITEIFNSGSMDFILFNKNDKEIYFLKGIWGQELDQNGNPIESHFSKHRYKILHYSFRNGGFRENEIGITKNRYSNWDDDKPGTEILSDIIKGENLIPKSTIVSDYVCFDNFEGKIMD